MSEKQSGSKEMNKKQRDEALKGMRKQRRDAFELYCQMREAGITKPFPKIADETGRAVGTIYNWSWSDNWKALYAEIEREATEEAMEQLKSGIMNREIKNKEFFIRALDKMESYILDNVEEFVGDYGNFFKLFQLALGEATDRIESNHGFSQEGMETLKKYIGAAKEIDDAKANEFMERLNKSKE